GARARPATSDVELLDQLACPRDQPAREEPTPLRIRGQAVVVQRNVLGDRELEHEAAPLPVLGDVTDAGVEQLAGASVRGLATGDPDAATFGLAQARDRLDQLALP